MRLDIKGLLIALVLVAPLCGVFAVPAGAQTVEEEDIRRAIATRAAGTAASLQETFRKLKYWIRNVPKDPDNPKRAYNDPTQPFLVNPLHGPLDDWAEGVDRSVVPMLGINPDIEARYCENILLVYVSASSLKGLGPDNHRMVQYGVQLLREQRGVARQRPGSPAVTSWLENGVVSEGELQSPVAVPACMGGLPSGRAALIGFVEDPWYTQTTRTEIEQQKRPCPAGHHSRIEAYRQEGWGQKWERRGKATYIRNGSQLGETLWEEWVRTADFCQPDYEGEEHILRPCSYRTASGQNKTGTSFYAIRKRVTAEAITYLGAAEFMSSTCWNLRPKPGRKPPPPLKPEKTSSTRTETQSASCGSGYRGSITNARTHTTTTLTFPWDQEPITATHVSGWSQSKNSCRRACTRCVERGGKEGDGSCISWVETSCYRGRGGGRGGGDQDGWKDLDGDGYAESEHHDRGCGSCSGTRGGHTSDGPSGGNDQGSGSSGGGSGGGWGP